MPMVNAKILAAACAFVAIAQLPAFADEGERTTIGTWQIQQSKSKVDDSPEIAAADVAPDQSDTSLSIKPGVMGILCRDHTTSLVVETGGFLGLDLDGAGVKVIYRVNGEPAVVKQWLSSINSQSVIYPASPISLIRSLPSQGEMLFRVYDYAGAYKENTFTLDGIDAVRAMVSKACQWPQQK